MKAEVDLNGAESFEELKKLGVSRICEQDPFSYRTIATEDNAEVSGKCNTEPPTVPVATCSKVR